MLAAAVLFSTGGAAIKGNAFTAWQVASFRCFIAAFALLLFVPSSRRGWSWRLLPAALAYAVTLILFPLAAKLTSSANAIFLQSTSPAYLILLSPWLLKEKVERKDLLLLFGVTVGMTFCFGAPQDATAIAPNPALGNAIALLSGVTWALTVVSLRRLRGSGTSSIVIGNFLAFALALPMAFPVAAVELRDVAILVYLGIFQIGLAYLCLTTALQHVPAFEASVLLLLEPALNPIWAWMILREHPGNWVLFGGAVILSATVWNTWSKREHAH